MKSKKLFKRLLVLLLVFSMTFTSVDLGFFTSYAAEMSTEESTEQSTEVTSNSVTEEMSETESVKQEETTTEETEQSSETSGETEPAESMEESTESSSEDFTEETTEEVTEEPTTEAETEEATEPEGEASTELEDGEQTDSLLGMFTLDSRASTKYVGTYSHSVLHSSIGSSTLGWTGRIQHWKIDGNPAICIQKGVNTPPIGTDYNRYDATNLPEDVRRAAAWFESTGQGTLFTLAAQYFAWAVIDGKDPLAVVTEAVTDYFTKTGDEAGLEWAVEVAQSYVSGIRRTAPANCFEWKLDNFQILITTTKVPGHEWTPPTDPTDPTEPTDPTPEPVEPDIQIVNKDSSKSASFNQSVSINKKYAAITGESLAGAVFDVYVNGVKKYTITTDASGKAQTPTWTIEGTGTGSASAKYCANYDSLTQEQKDALPSDIYHSLAEAEAAAQSAADEEAQRNANNSSPSCNVEIKEAAPPHGFHATGDSNQSGSVSGSGNKSFSVKNNPWKAKLILDKVDGLTGGRLTKDAEFVIYEWNGTEYVKSSNYKMIRLEDGTYTAQANYADAEQGYVYYTQKNEGKFGVGEVSAPDGYIKDEEIFYFQITEDNQTIAAHNVHPEYYDINDPAKWSNQPAHVYIEIPKIDRYSGNMIVSDAEFVVYTESGEFSRPVTFTKQADGSYKSNEIYYADTFDNANYGLFYAVEQTAPDGYYGDWKDDNGEKTDGSETNKVQYQFSVFEDLSNHDTVIKITNDDAGAAFWNEHQYGMVDIHKYDNEAEADDEDGNRVTQGDTTTLDGAVYGLYANEDIYHPDGVTGLLYHKDDLVATATVGETPIADSLGYLLDADGNRCIESGKEPATTTTPGSTGFRQVELGHYYISEIEPPFGYLPDTTEHRGDELMKYYVSFEYEGESKPVIVRKERAKDDDNSLTMDDGFDSPDIWSGDFVFKQAAQFVKLEDLNSDTEKDPLAAGFSIYRLAALEGVRNGSITPDGEAWTKEDMVKFKNYDFRNDPKVTLYKRQSEVWTAGDTAWLKPTGEHANEYYVDEMFSGEEDGYFVTPELPYGQYILFESTVPEGKRMADPVLVTISADSAKPQPIRYIGDETTDTYIRIQKKDSDAADGEFNTVLKPGAKYRLRLTSDRKDFDNEIWTVDPDGYLWYYSPSLNARHGSAEAPFAVKCIYKDGKIIDAYVELEQLLPTAEYEITEVEAPDGYVINGSEQDFVDTSTGSNNSYEIVDNPWKKVVFTIDNDVVYPDGQAGENKYAMTDEYGRLVITITQENKEQKGIVEITKLGEQLYDTAATGSVLRDKITGELTIPVGDDILDTADQVFDYELAPVRGAKFEIYAAEDIYTQQLQDDLMGDYADDVNHYLVHHKDDLIGTITTDNSGFAYLADLYIGKYYIREIVAGDGFVINTYIDEFEITSAESNVNFILYESSYENERQKVDVTVIKKDADTDEIVQGAAFGLYNKEDIVSCIKEENGKYVIDETGRKLLDADTLIATAVTGEDGTAHFDVDLPLGEYYVIELMPPAGFHTSDDVIELDAAYAGQTVETIVLEKELKNEPTKIEISKTDITTGEEIIGAALVIKDEDGNVVDEWVTDGEKHLIKYLLLGKTYTLSEKLPASGYVTALDVPFTILDRDTDGSILLLQKVEMADDYTKVVIKKTDIETGDGVIGATLELRNKETGETAASWTTSAEGEIINFHAANDQITYELEAGLVYITYLPIGEYILVEAGTPLEDGYVTADPMDVVIEDTGDEQAFEMKDDFTKLDISKVEAATGEELPGAHLILKDKDGNIVDEWDSTDTPHRIERIPAGEYTLMEETAPFGYIIAEEITFEVEDTGVVQKVVMKDDYTVAELAKTDFTTGLPVIGATLTLYKAVEENDGTFTKGEVVLTWETTDGSEVPNVDGEYQYDIKDGADGLKYWINENGKLTVTHIPVGNYILEETITPGEYMTAEDVVVVIRNVGGQTEIQKTVMYDKAALVVDKSTIKETQCGDTYKYTLDHIRNNTDTALENFTLTDYLPKEVVLKTLWTGTFSDELTYSISYKTSQNDWRLWKDGLSTGENLKLEVKDLNLEKGEQITEFKYEWGTVPAGFREVKAPIYFVTVKNGLAANTQLINKVNLYGEYNGKPIEDNDETVTKIYEDDITETTPPTPGRPDLEIDENEKPDGNNGGEESFGGNNPGVDSPNTGDTMNAGVLAALIMCMMLSACGVVIIRRKKRAE